MRESFGAKIFQADLPELPELDNLFAPEGVIQEAQALAAQAFGASQTWFLVNGSTVGIIASILTVCNPGEKIILPRNIHQSVISGLILSGAIPVFINPEYDPNWDLAHSITPSAVAAALAAHPQAKAVMMVYPTYQGVCGDVKAIATLTHKYGIPLLVDEAHGAHFTFHSQLPTAALAAGADLTVQSIHKTLSAMTQSSMLQVQGERIDRQKLSQTLQLLQSSSPNYLLLASLDAARHQMAIAGPELITQTLQLADQARNRLKQIPGLSVLEPTTPTPGVMEFDRTRLTVKVSDLGINGFTADEILTQQGVIAELPSLRQLTFIISLGNTQTDIDRLVQAFTWLAQTKTNPPNFLPIHLLPCPKAQLSPRAAFFAPTTTLPIENTSDRISAELICPYPPGIPILVPGEIITTVAWEYLQQIRALGGKIIGCSNPTLATLKVVQS